MEKQDFSCYVSQFYFDIFLSAGWIPRNITCTLNGLLESPP